MAKSFKGSLPDNELSPLGVSSIGSHQQVPVLISEKKTGRQGIDSDPIAIPSCKLYRIPLSIAVDSGLPHVISQYFGNCSLRIHGGDVYNAPPSVLSDCLSK